MGLLDKVKGQAEAGLAKAAEAGRAGQAKLEEVQATRAADALLKSLGTAVYAKHAGTADAGVDAEIDRITAELDAHFAQHGAAGA